MTIKNKIKEFIKLVYICPHYRTILRVLKKNKNSKIILFGTPAHGNLGDQAIAISELDFLQKNSGERNVVEIPMPLFKTHRKTIKNYVGDEDTIVISGGGWMGNLWIHNEITIREIVSDYEKNRVVIFPQTLYYTDDEYGIQTIKDTKAVFCSHSDLILTVRDPKSFECADKKLGFKDGKNLFFCPDMVAYGTLAQKVISAADDDVILVCLRNDREKKCNTDSIKNNLLNAGYTLKETTTVRRGLIPIRKRAQLVKEKIIEFQSASLIITDRLHAMLFAILSGTPCLAFDNTTGKVFGVGEYLKKSGLPVYLIDHLNLSEIKGIKLMKKEYFLSEEFKAFFLKLAFIVNSRENI